MNSGYTDLPQGSWKNPVASASDLPPSDNNPGDAIITIDTDIIYIWNGSSWVTLASTIPGFGTIDSFFGSGTDGDLTVSSGTLVFDSDKYFDQLVVNGTGRINKNGFRLSALELDISHAASYAIFDDGEDGESGGINSSSQVLGGQPSAATSNTVGIGQYGGDSGAGGVADNDWNGGIGIIGDTRAVYSAGGNADLSSGAGGDDDGEGAAGGAGVPNVESTFSVIPQYPTHDLFVSGGPIIGGGGGSGGGGGAGNMANSGPEGPAGGAGGAGGGISWIAAKRVIRSNSNPSIICSRGGQGGDGGHITTPLNGCGGGGAGTGGGGGFIYFIFSESEGSICENFFDASGGKGGDGGNAIGGENGTGGGGGDSGNIVAINIKTGAFYKSSGSEGTAASGIFGGLGGVNRMAL